MSQGRQFFVTQLNEQGTQLDFDNAITALADKLGLPHERANISSFFDSTIYPLMRIKERKYYDSMVQAFRGELRRQVEAAEVRLKEVTENYKDKEQLVDLLRSQIERQRDDFEKERKRLILLIIGLRQALNRAGLQEDLNMFAGELDDIVSLIKNERVSVVGSVESVSEMAMSRRGSRIPGKQSSVADFTNKQMQYELRINTLQASLNQGQMDMKNLESQNAQLLSDTNTLKEENEELKKKLKTALDQLNKIQSDSNNNNASEVQVQQLDLYEQTEPLNESTFVKENNIQKLLDNMKEEIKQYPTRIDNLVMLLTMIFKDKDIVRELNLSSFEYPEKPVKDAKNYFKKFVEGNNGTNQKDLDADPYRWVNNNSDNEIKKKQKSDILKNAKKNKKNKKNDKVLDSSKRTPTSDQNSDEENTEDVQLIGYLGKKWATPVPMIDIGVSTKMFSELESYHQQQQLLLQQQQQQLLKNQSSNRGSRFLNSIPQEGGEEQGQDRRTSSRQSTNNNNSRNQSRSNTPFRKSSPLRESSNNSRGRRGSSKMSNSRRESSYRNSTIDNNDYDYIQDDETNNELGDEEYFSHEVEKHLTACYIHLFNYNPSKRTSMLASRRGSEIAMILSPKKPTPNIFTTPNLSNEPVPEVQEPIIVNMNEESSSTKHISSPLHHNVINANDVGYFDSFDEENNNEEQQNVYEENSNNNVNGENMNENENNEDNKSINNEVKIENNNKNENGNIKENKEENTLNNENKQSTSQKSVQLSSHSSNSSSNRISKQSLKNLIDDNNNNMTKATSTTSISPSTLQEAQTAVNYNNNDNVGEVSSTELNNEKIQQHDQQQQEKGRGSDEIDVTKYNNVQDIDNYYYNKYNKNNDEDKNTNVNNNEEKSDNTKNNNNEEDDEERDILKIDTNTINSEVQSLESPTRASVTSSPKNRRVSFVPENIRSSEIMAKKTDEDSDSDLEYEPAQPLVLHKNSDNMTKVDMLTELYNTVKPPMFSIGIQCDIYNWRPTSRSESSSRNRNRQYFNITTPINIDHSEATTPLPITNPKFRKSQLTPITANTKIEEQKAALEEQEALIERGKENISPIPVKKVIMKKTKKPRITDPDVVKNEMNLIDSFNTILKTRQNDRNELQTLLWESFAIRLTLLKEGKEYENETDEKLKNAISLHQKHLLNKHLKISERVNDLDAILKNETEHVVALAHNITSLFSSLLPQDSMFFPFPELYQQERPFSETIIRGIGYDSINSNPNSPKSEKIRTKKQLANDSDENDYNNYRNHNFNSSFAPPGDPTGFRTPIKQIRLGNKANVDMINDLQSSSSISSSKNKKKKDPYYDSNFYDLNEIIPSFHKSYYEDVNERGNFPQLDIPTNHSYIPRLPKDPFPTRCVRFNKHTSRHIMDPSPHRIDGYNSSAVSIPSNIRESPSVANSPRINSNSTSPPPTCCNKHKTERTPRLFTNTVSYDIVHRPEPVFPNPPITPTLK